MSKTRPTATAAPEAELPVLDFATAEAWRAWLDAHHADAVGIWLRMARKGSGIPSVTYAEALDVALCYGWIDGLKRGESAALWRQKFTPRRVRSLWSKVNRGKVEAFIASGAMRAPGLAEVERAQADGRWDRAYDPASAATVPDDLQSALDASPSAAAEFAALDRANRYAILWRLQTAKKLETRQQRLARFVAMLERGERLH